MFHPFSLRSLSLKNAYVLYSYHFGQEVISCPGVGDQLAQRVRGPIFSTVLLKQLLLATNV